MPIRWLQVNYGRDEQMSVEVEKWTAEAYELGADAARTAASWVTDGNLSAKHYAQLIAMMDDGDPALEDYLPTQPNLSGEWADAPTPGSLFELVTGLDASAEFNTNDQLFDIQDALCDAWEAGVADTFGPECERFVRAAVAS